MKKATLHLTVIFLCLLLLSPVYTPILAQTSLTVNVTVGDFNGNGYADIKFTVKDAQNQPKSNAKIELTPEGSPIPIYINYTNAYGIYVFEDMPPDTYTWTCTWQSGAITLTANGTVTINAEDYPLSISEKEEFWNWFMIFVCDAPEGEKGKALLQFLADITGYDTSTHPIPPKGASDAENAKA
ncbi:MAG: carboxypeptidase-like regulatory domain-containing protein [Candidatus Bathyarchaeia archaeon]